MSIGPSACASRSLRLRAPAKINWALEVIGCRDDGFHEIQTVLQAVSLFDDLEVTRRPRPVCSIRCDDPRVPTDRTNLIARAWGLMHEAHPEKVGGIAVDLKKRIPLGAGLGGGSSDAAASLIAINRLFDLRLRQRTLSRHAASIGSDVAFFLKGGAAWGRGRGEIIESIPSSLPRLHLVIVYPGFQSATARAYAQLSPGDFGEPRGVRRTLRAIEGGDPARLKESQANTFDRVLCRADPRYRALKHAMKQAGLARPMLAGSGSACFAWAEDPARARAAAAKLKTRYPWAYATQTLHSGVRFLR